jgi:ABC-type multidrug transport system fused ATPase/permease subunit
MDARHRIKRAAAALMVGFLLAMAFAATAFGGNGVPRGMTAQQWKAMLERSQALNRIYGPVSPRAEAQRAVERRDQAINQYYHLGRYAVVRVSSRFDWADAGIGAGVTLGAILLGGGLALTVRRRVVDQTASPSTT